MLKEKLKKEGGFTLLELLIVIVIIGILAALIIPNITSAPKKARDTTRKADLTSIKKSLEEYYTSNSSYPTQATAALAATALGGTSGALTSGNPPLMKSVPADPKNPTSTTLGYLYTSADGTSYTLHGCLENGNEAAGNGTVADTNCTSGKAYVLTSAN